MKGTVLAAAAIVVGLLVLGGGPVALSVVPTQAFWSDEQQAAYEKASTAAHAAAFGGEHDHGSSHSAEPVMDSDALAERDATRAEFEKHFATLKAAQQSQRWLGIGCRILGATIAAGGVLLYFRSARSEAG